MSQKGLHYNVILSLQQKKRNVVSEIHLLFFQNFGSEELNEQRIFQEFEQNSDQKSS